MSSAMCFFSESISTSFCFELAASAASFSLSFIISVSAPTNRSTSLLLSFESLISTEKLL